MESSPMFSFASKKTVHEGDKMGTLFTDGRHSVRDLHHVQSGFSIPQEDIPSMKPSDLLDKFAGVAVDMAGQMERGFLQLIDESLEGTDNVISGSMEFNHDFILIGLEKMRISFEDDDRTKPVKPTIFASPELINKLIQAESEATPEEKEAYRQKEEIIMNKKYEEYLKDLKSRKLVD